ncbi:MAG: FtsX-like permease family protein [Granulosicoccus sp.]
MLLRILARSSWQFYRHHPAQLLLSMLGIVLGVGIVTAVLVTNNSSQRAFALSTEALYGRTTHQLSGANGLDQAVYVKLRNQFSHFAMAPVITGHIAIGEQVFSLLGLDPFAEAVFNRIGTASPTSETTDRGTSQAGNLPIQALLQRDALIISESSAQTYKLPVGETINLSVGGEDHEAYLAATYTSDNPAATAGLMIGDIAFAQALLSRGSKIDRVDLILDSDQVQLLEAAIPATLQLTPAISRTQTMQAMTRGFHINLTAMSLLALVVGAFLIHNTMTFAVVQRRELFAIKRITGITARTVLYSILLEATLISSVASLAGIVLGYFLSSALIKLTTRTINDLYFVLHVQEIWFSPWLIATGLLLGIGSSLLAACLAAFDAASTSPIQARQRSLIEERTHRLLPFMAISGLLIMIFGALLSVLPLQSLIIGFVALMLIILGYGLLIPWLVFTVTRTLKPWLDTLGVSMSLAAGGIYRNISRTGLAIAALSIAVSATFGVDVMIGSFRSTVDQWLGTTLQSDIYITAPKAVTTENARFLASDSMQLAQATAGVKSVSNGRTIDARTSVGNVDMLVIQPHEQSEQGFELISEISGNPWRAWLNDQTLMISEPLATKHDLQPGDSLQVFTELEGFTSFGIVAVFRDYGSSHGKLLMARPVFDRYWDEPGIGSLGIILEDTANDEVVMDSLRLQLSSVEQPLIIQSNTAIHRQSLIVFDRTFEVTRVLRWLTVGVAFVGIFSALLALHLERAREFAILRASGATRRRIMSVVLTQTVLMGLLAGTLALPLGWLMSEVLIKVINVRSFGWSMQSIMPVGSIPETLFLALLSAVLAGFYPAYRLSRRSIAAQLRDD